MPELLLVAAVSALALMPLLGWLRRSQSQLAMLCVVVSWVSGVGWAAVAYHPARVIEEEVRRRPSQIPDQDYVGSDACRACHPAQYSSWHASYHRSMTQIPSRESMIPVWDGIELRYQYSYRLEQRGEEYWAVSDDPAWSQADSQHPPGERQIVLITGSHHEQFFWIPAEKDRELALFPIVYRIKEERWLPYRAVLLTPETLAGDQTARWNSVCINCHSVRGQPRFERLEFEGETRIRMDTTVSEFGISCEACHGPAREHVRANIDPIARYANHLGEDGDPTIINPARLSAKRSTDVCGSCHSVFLFNHEQTQSLLSTGHSFRPGEDLRDSRLLVRYRDRSDPALREATQGAEEGFAQRFWKDGMPSTNGREMSGLVESECFQKGELSCLSCHSMHKDESDPQTLDDWRDDQMRAEMESNEACLQCHENYRERVSEHTHHPAESSASLCYNCHMPNTAYGLLKQTRSHLIDSPSVANTLHTNRPNACNLCHLDETLAWSADRLEDWYGTPKPALTEADEFFTADSIVRGLSGDAGLRAMIAWHMGWEPAIEASGSDWMVPVLAQLLEDPYFAVRHLAEKSLRSRAGWDDFPYSYLAGPEQLERGHRDALALWDKSAPPQTRRKGEEILIDRSGQVMGERFERLRRNRDNSMVYRQE